MQYGDLFYDEEEDEEGEEMQAAGFYDEEEIADFLTWDTEDDTTEPPTTEESQTVNEAIQEISSHPTHQSNNPLVLDAPAHHMPRLNNSLRQLVLQWILDRKIGPDPRHGSMIECANLFGYTPKTVSRVWNRAKAQKQPGKPYNADNKMINCGRKRITVDPTKVKGLTMD